MLNEEKQSFLIGSVVTLTAALTAAARLAEMVPGIWTGV